MAIDPNIALSVRGPQFESPINAMRNAMEIGAYQNKMQQQQQALQQQQQLRNFLSTANLGDPTVRNQLNAYDPSGETFKNVESGYEARGKGEMETFKLALAKYSEFRNRLGGLAAANASRDEVISEVHNAVQEGLLTPEIGKHFEDTLPTDPTQLQTRLIRGARENASPEQIVAMFAPKIESQDMGGGGRLLRVNPYAGKAEVIPGSEFTKTLSPAESERLSIERQREERLAATVDPASYPNVYQAVSEGRIPISRVNSRTAAIFEGVLAKNPDADLTGMNEEQIRNLAGARTGGVTQQNLEMAGTEARNMISVARNAAKAANLSNLKAVNQFTRWLGGQAGNPKYAALNTAINSLVNSYARAINPRGVPTVSDKQHAREILDSAMAAGNLEAAFNMMETEIAAAHAAAGVGPGGKKPPATAPAAAPSGNENAPKKITSDAEFNNLPSGSLFIGPDGKTRRKP